MNSWKDLTAFTRTNAQGRPALGFGVVLLVLLLTLGGGLYALNVVHFEPKKDPAVKKLTSESRDTRTGKGSPVAQPELFKNALPDNARERGNKSLETLYGQHQVTNQSGAPQESKPAENPSEGWVPKFSAKRLEGLGKPNDRFGSASAPDTREKPGTKNAEETYHFVEQLLVITNAAAPIAKKESGFEIKKFLPRGHKIPIVLLSKINTAVGKMPVELAIAKDVYFNGHLQLPFGWHLIGNASQGPNHKVNVGINTIIDPQGKEYPITAMALSMEQEPGFDGYALQSPLMMELLPLASTAVKTFMDAAKDVTTQQSVVPNGGSTIVGSQQTYMLNAKSKLLDGTAQMLSGLMADKSKELTKLYPEGSVVPRGTIGWALLTAPLDMTLGREGGSAEFLQKDDANPEPNVITLRQQQGTVPAVMPMMPGAQSKLPPGIQLPPAAMAADTKQLE